MSLLVRTSPMADAQAFEMADRIADDSMEVALRFMAALARQYADIASYPDVGSSCADWRTGVPNLRRCTIQGFPNHLIFYARRGKEVHVFCVLHGARNIPPVLRKALKDKDSRP